MTQFENVCRKAARMLAAADYAVFFGGAGISTDSGLADFRSRKGGLYNEPSGYGVPAEEILTPAFYEARTAEFFDYYRTKLRTLAAPPNPVPYALAGLAGREQENYLHFSEGQKQLCILARTLVSGSSLLLLDEPESALDFQYRYRTMQLLRNWVREKERAVLAALHDPLLALNSCDSLLVLANGRVQALLSPAGDPPEEMERQLSAVYGAVSLHRCTDRSGRHQWVMLKEPESSDRKRGRL